MTTKEQKKKIPNPNHPKKGAKIEVEPIRNPKDIERIKYRIWGYSRNYLLFVLGINNAARISDLLELKTGDFWNIQSGQVHQFEEARTGKINYIVVNDAVRYALDHHFERHGNDAEEYLFKSFKGQNQPIRIHHVNKLVKKWTKDIGLEGNYGAHTLRKTWGYQQRVRYGVGFDALCKRYNHPGPSYTMRYLGFEERDLEGFLMNEI